MADGSQADPQPGNSEPHAGGQEDHQDTADGAQAGPKDPGESPKGAGQPVEDGDKPDGPPGAGEEGEEDLPPAVESNKSKRGTSQNKAQKPTPTKGRGKRKAAADPEAEAAEPATPAKRARKKPAEKPAAEKQPAEKQPAKKPANKKTETAAAGESQISLRLPDITDKEKSVFRDIMLVFCSAMGDWLDAKGKGGE